MHIRLKLIFNGYFGQSTVVKNSSLLKVSLHWTVHNSFHLHCSSTAPESSHLTSEHKIFCHFAWTTWVFKTLCLVLAVLVLGIQYKVHDVSTAAHHYFRSCHGVATIFCLCLLQSAMYEPSQIICKRKRIHNAFSEDTSLFWFCLSRNNASHTKL